MWWRDYGQGGASGPTLLLRAADGGSNRPFGQIVAGSQDPAFKRAMARFLLWPCQRLGGGSERAAIAGDCAAFLASSVARGTMAVFIDEVWSMKLLRKELDIHLPSVGVMIRVTEDGVELLADRVNLKSPSQGVFHVDKDNWIITPDPLGGIELHSADAAARFERENRAGDNVHELQFVRNEEGSNV